MNAASRVLGIVEAFQGIGNKTIDAGWRRTLEIGEGPDADAELFAAIQAFLAEIKSVQTRLGQLDVPPGLFDAAAARLRNTFSPVQLTSSWSGHRESASGEGVLSALRWAAWVLRQFDENDLDVEALGALQVSLQEQEELLARSTLPPNLRELLERQVLALRAALHLYKIQGVDPLRRAVHATLGEVVSEDRLNPEVMAAASPETKSVVQKGLQMLSKAAETADKGSKIAKFAKEMYEWATPALRCEINVSGASLGCARLHGLVFVNLRRPVRGSTVESCSPRLTARPAAPFRTVHATQRAIYFEGF